MATPFKTVLKNSLTEPRLVDVKFWVFSKRVNRVAFGEPDSDPPPVLVCKPLPIFGISSLLKQYDQYFNDLLSGGFSEASDNTTFYSPHPPNVPNFTDVYDYESDSDLDDETEGTSYPGPKRVLVMDDSKSGSPSPAEEKGRISPRPFTFELPVAPKSATPEGVRADPQCRQVIIKDMAYLTWHALIYYIYTEDITFLDLRSKDPAQRKASTRYRLSHMTDSEQSPACSPKSMYRLAEKLGLEALQKKALDSIKDRLSPQVILREVFSRFTTRYPAVMDLEMDYLCAHFEDKAIKNQWPTTLKTLLQSGSTHAEEALTILLSKRLTTAPCLPRNISSIEAAPKKDSSKAGPSSTAAPASDSAFDPQTFFLGPVHQPPRGSRPQLGASRTIETAAIGNFFSSSQRR